MNKASFEYLEGGSKVTAYLQCISNTEDYGYEENWREGVFYFSAGKMISYATKGDGILVDVSWESEYDANGNIVRESRDFGGWIEEYKYQYDKNGNKIRVEKSGTDGDEITEYQYNENGKEIRIESNGTNGNGITEYQYNEYGNLIRTVSVQDEGKEGKVTTERQYDENGKETKYERTIERWTYDEEGNITQRTSSDENIISEYDKDGKLISYAYLHSSTEGDVVSYDSQYLYDEQGRIVEITVDGQTAVTVNYSSANILDLHFEISALKTA